MTANVRRGLVRRAATWREGFGVFARDRLLVVAVASGGACALMAGRKNFRPNVAERHSLINQFITLASAYKRQHARRAFAATSLY